MDDAVVIYLAPPLLEPGNGDKREDGLAFQPPFDGLTAEPVPPGSRLLIAHELACRLGSFDGLKGKYFVANLTRKSHGLFMRRVDDDDYRMRGNEIVDDFFLEQEIIRVEFRLRSLPDAQAEFREVPIGFISPHETAAAFSGQDLRLRMHEFPFFPAHHPARQDFELSARKLSRHRQASGMVPFGIGLFIVHHERLAVKDAFVPEFQRCLPAVEFDNPAVHHSRLAKRSPADVNRGSPHGIVDQFVEAHHGNRISLSLPV